MKKIIVLVVLVAGMVSCTQLPKEKDYSLYESARSAYQDTVKNVSMKMKWSKMKMDLNFNKDTMVFSFYYLPHVDGDISQWTKKAENSNEYIKDFVEASGVEYTRIRLWNHGEEVYNFIYKIRYDKYDIKFDLIDTKVF